MKMEADLEKRTPPAAVQEKDVDRGDDMVSDEMRKLVLYVASAFYLPEDFVILDLLMRKENCEMLLEELRRTLQFDSKTLRGRLTTLKAQKIIKDRRSDERGGRGKKEFIRFDCNSFVRSTQYKLEQMRKKIETQEMGYVPREFFNFKCTNCTKKYHVFKAYEIFDQQRKEFRCPFCYALVEEEVLQEDPILFMGNFNSQMEPIFTLLKAVSMKKRESPEKSFNVNVVNSDGHWCGERTRVSLNRNDQVRVILPSEDAEDDYDPMEVDRKEMPIWMVQPTIPPMAKDNYFKWMTQSSWVI